MAQWLQRLQTGMQATGGESIAGSRDDCDGGCGGIAQNGKQRQRQRRRRRATGRRRRQEQEIICHDTASPPRVPRVNQLIEYIYTKAHLTRKESELDDDNELLLALDPTGAASPEQPSLARLSKRDKKGGNRAALTAHTHSLPASISL